MKPVFESKEYGIGGHNKLEIRIFPEEGVQIWLRDGECNAIVFLDREDMTKLAKVVNKVKDQALEEIEPYDFSVPVHKRKKIVTTSESKAPKKARKPRSDKGKKKNETYEEMKARKIAEAMND
jgi:hypothetical protein